MHAFYSSTRCLGFALLLLLPLLDEWPGYDRQKKTFSECHAYGHRDYHCGLPLLLGTIVGNGHLFRVRTDFRVAAFVTILRLLCGLAQAQYVEWLSQIV